uniref:Uncharacterized protein n=1 Tax=Arundo donax TaxID=35708 RepID=A0A0A8ZDA0_ARUDO
MASASDRLYILWYSALMYCMSISALVTTTRISAESLVPSPFIALCSTFAKYLAGFSAQRRMVSRPNPKLPDVSLLTALSRERSYMWW